MCGDHTNPILGALDEHGIRLVDTRDERGAAWMAAGYALATGEPGLVVVSNTPALTNAATALADAHFSGTPLVCLTGGVGLPDRGRGHPGDQDQVAIAAPISGWVRRATHADQAGAITAEAFDAARGGRPSVAVLELPMDVQQSPTEVAVAMAPQRTPLAPDQASVARIRALLSDARRPVIVAGSGCHWSGAGEALRAFVEASRIPVFTVRAARGLISDDHELCFGFPNLLAEPTQIVFGEADVVVVLGTKLDLLIGNGAFHPGCTLIRVDIAPNAFAVGRAAEVAVIADVGAVLEELLDGVEPLDTDDWVKRLREATDARDRLMTMRSAINSHPLHPGRLVAEIAAKMPENAIVTVDAGALALWAIDGLRARMPGAFHVSSTSALGALGMGLPWAIGMKIAHPERPVLALVGDGSFGFTAMEVETSARHNAPVAVVVGNDGGWGIVRHLQRAIEGRALASDLPRSPYELLAEFAGGVGDRVETPKQLSIAVTNALVADVPSVINAIIDPSVQHEAMPFIAAMFAAKQP